MTWFRWPSKWWPRKKLKMLWISHPIFDLHEPGSRHPDVVGRIAAIQAELKYQQIWPNLKQIQAEEASDKQLALVHARQYLYFLESMCPQPGKIYRVDDDTVIGHDSLVAARYAAGAVIKAVDAVMEQKAQHAFCAIRPPGHHAQSRQAGGFCLINNVAVGVMHAIAHYRLQRVVIVDFDVHHNDGTAEIFANDPRVLLLNSCSDSIFPFPKQSSQPDNAINIFLPAGSGSKLMRERVRAEWLPKLDKFRPELVVFSAGFDANRQDPTGNLNWHEADYAWLTHKIIQTASNSCDNRFVSALEGGYDLDALGKSAAAHLYVLSGMGKPPCAVEYDKQLREIDNDQRSKMQRYFRRSKG